VVAGEDAHDAVARGLRLGRDNGEAIVLHEAIHQRRLTHIGFSQDADKAGLKVFCCHFLVKKEYKGSFLK
jgi:hypothetical protein